MISNEISKVFKIEIFKMIMSVVFVIIIFMTGFGMFKLTTEVLILCGLLLVLLTITELTEFNVWGFKGKTKVINESAENLPGESISAKPETKDIEPNQPLNLMHPDIGNFLAIVFEVERLLRISAESFGLDNARDAPFPRLLEYLYRVEFITSVGKMRLESVSKLRNFLVHGRNHEITESDLQAGFELANNFYQELYANLFSEQEEK